MNTDLLLGGTFLVGILATCWARVKDLSNRVIGLMIVKAKISDEAGIALSYYCWSKMQRCGSGERSFGSLREFARPLKRHQIIGFEKVGGQATIFWQGWKPLLVGFESGDANKAESWGIKVSFLRGTFDIDNLLVNAIDFLNDWKHKGKDSSRFRIERRTGVGSLKMRTASDTMAPTYSKEEKFNPDMRLLKWKLGELGEDQAEDPWEALAFPKEILALFEECKRWLESESWYRKKLIPWRRGILLYGRPGTGKTSLVRAIAQDLDLPIMYFDLASMSNREFIEAWKELMNMVPCIALLEDVDVVFKGRENRLGEDGGGLTFDCLLNCMSGIIQANGALVFVTTNKIEDLDPALGISEKEEAGMSTRPGRIDRAVELFPLDEECRRSAATRILSEYPEEVESIIKEGEGDTGAQFIDRCASIALKRYWGENHDL